jgi:hypothetical protein
VERNAGRMPQQTRSITSAAGCFSKECPNFA